MAGARAQVLLAGRVAETAVFGAANISSAGAADIMHANHIAREMIFKCGWSDTIGPVSIMDDNRTLRSAAETLVGDMSPQMAVTGMHEIQRLLAACEAKAYFGIVCNWRLLQAMADHILTNKDRELRRCVFLSALALSRHGFGGANGGVDLIAGL